MGQVKPRLSLTATTTTHREQQPTAHLRRGHPPPLGHSTHGRSPLHNMNACLSPLARTHIQPPLLKHSRDPRPRHEVTPPFKAVSQRVNGEVINRSNGHRTHMKGNLETMQTAAAETDGKHRSFRGIWGQICSPFYTPWLNWGATPPWLKLVCLNTSPQ